MLLICSMLLWSSCKDDGAPIDKACKDVECLHGGTCSDGVCDCVGTRYEGPNCATCQGDKFDGTYIVNDTVNNTHHTYTASISTNQQSCDGYLYFQDMSDPIMGRLNFTDGKGFSLSGAGGLPGISGSGSIDATGQVITLSYSYFDGIYTNEGSATMTKQ